MAALGTTAGDGPWWTDVARELVDVPALRATRWLHLQAVGRKAETLAPLFDDENDAVALIASAWLHDIGYAEPLQVHGFHPIDGADELLRRGVPERIAALVAHHTGAVHEASLRGLSAELGRFRDEVGPVRDALWTCDLTTSPTGEPVDVDERLREIAVRYGPDHAVTRAIASASAELRACVARTRKRARAVGIDVHV